MKLSTVRTACVWVKVARFAQLVSLRQVLMHGLQAAIHSFIHSFIHFASLIRMLVNSALGRSSANVLFR
jgi:hypothetical protein